MADSLTLTLKIDAEADADEQELQVLTSRLKTELEDLKELESVDLARKDEAPARAKAGDPIAWGELILALFASGGVLTTLIGALQHWLSRHERRSITLEIAGDKLNVTGVTSEEQQRLIQEWISRHATVAN
jgi:hypothetical protein